MTFKITTNCAMQLGKVFFRLMQDTHSLQLLPIDIARPVSLKWVA